MQHRLYDACHRTELAHTTSRQLVGSAVEIILPGGFYQQGIP